ncbi:MAG: tRNA (adenosine(37)-N6)-dimethylallyltransferase MiaA [Bacteroidaceae bacterium]|nr:tRNA (adenosine(37)-N6)-dimethylallyltransferase MiaA [Bacteroidaceae bacterium]
MASQYDFTTILGPTASGKTTLACRLAQKTGAEIISGDSRQVYRGMDIGTGKDLSDYVVDGKAIPYHLIDIVNPGYKYSVYEYQRDFLSAYNDIKSRNKPVLLCGGSGLYLESVIRSYRLSPVPPNPTLREELADKSIEELTEILKRYKTLHNTTDIDSPQRAIRAIEIEEHYLREPLDLRSFPQLNSLNIGIDVDRDVRRERISRRLKQRLEEGMLDEIRRLLDSGIAAEDLIYYGLEYKYLTLHVIGQLSHDEMFRQLEIAIHQFAKRQMTWFRGMERRGVKIHWIKEALSEEEKIEQIMALMG